MFTQTNTHDYTRTCIHDYKNVYNLLTHMGIITQVFANMFTDKFTNIFIPNINY
jgi:hypothetical protein